MKKILCLVLAAMLLVPALGLCEGAVKMGQVYYAAHGDRGFAVMTVAMDGDTIVGATIDEFQFMDATAVTGVPNSDGTLGQSFPEGQVLGSKKINSDYYSENMKKAGSTISIADNFAAIEAYVTGKTVAELEAAVEGKDAASFLEADVVSSCTLADTYGYVMGIIEAAKAAK